MNDDIDVRVRHAVRGDYGDLPDLHSAIETVVAEMRKDGFKRITNKMRHRIETAFIASKAFLPNSKIVHSYDCEIDQSILDRSIGFGNTSPLPDRIGFKIEYFTVVIGGVEYNEKFSNALEAKNFIMQHRKNSNN